MLHYIYFLESAVNPLYYNLSKNLDNGFECQKKFHVLSCDIWRDDRFKKPQNDRLLYLFMFVRLTHFTFALMKLYKSLKGKTLRCNSCNLRTWRTCWFVLWIEKWDWVCPRKTICQHVGCSESSANLIHRLYWGHNYVFVRAPIKLSFWNDKNQIFSYFLKIIFNWSSVITE